MVSLKFLTFTFYEKSFKDTQKFKCELFLRTFLDFFFFSPHCENNQEYKVRALKNFVPQRESDFDRELEAFERRIEQSCAPCINCQREIDRFLAQQSGK